MIQKSTVAVLLHERQSECETIRRDSLLALSRNGVDEMTAATTNIPFQLKIEKTRRKQKKLEGQCNHSWKFAFFLLHSICLYKNKSVKVAPNSHRQGAVVVVKWSAGSPSIPMI